MVQKWIRRFGYENYRTLHHYCDSLLNINRAVDAAKRGDREKERSSIKVALDEVNYNLRYATRDLVLFPEMLVTKARILEMQDRDEDAARVYVSTIRRFPHYAQAYLGLSSYYERHGESIAMKKLLRIGVRRAKNSSLVKDRLDAVERGK